MSKAIKIPTTTYQGQPRAAVTHSKGTAGGTPRHVSTGQTAKVVTPARAYTKPAK
jgi:hypothetical protein